MTAHLTQTAIWVGVVVGLAVVFGALAALVNAGAGWIERALTDAEPAIDDVAERRRVKAAAFAARRQQLRAVRR